MFPCLINGRQEIPPTPVCCVRVTDVHAPDPDPGDVPPISHTCRMIPWRLSRPSCHRENPSVPPALSRCLRLRVESAGGNLRQAVSPQPCHPVNRGFPSCREILRARHPAGRPEKRLSRFSRIIRKNAETKFFGKRICKQQVLLCRIVCNTACLQERGLKMPCDTVVHHQDVTPNPYLVPLTCCFTTKK